MLRIFTFKCITISEHDNHSDSFQVKFPNVFTNYVNREMKVEDQRYINWDHYKFSLWQTQLNFVVFYASSACGVSIEHMNAKKPMIRSIYHFHVYYHIRRILERFKIPLPFENSLNQYNNPYNHERFMEICGEYEFSNDLKEWRNQKYFSTWQPIDLVKGTGGVTYTDINDNSFSRWIIENTSGLTKIGLQKLSEMVRDYVYLILTSQASTGGPVFGYSAQNFDAQKVVLNTFENIINRRVDIPEDIQRFQKTSQCAGSKVDYVIG